jgi:hypothetical protein
MKKIATTSALLGQTLTAGTVLAEAPPTTYTAPNIPFIPDGNMSTLVGFISTVGGWLLYAAGAIAVVFLIIGGIQYMISAGNAEKAAAAKKTIIYALIGVVVVAASLFLIGVVLSLVGAK